MSNIFKIMKKELDKIFKDKRLIFTTFILPALLIFIIYTCMGNMMMGSGTETESVDSKVVYYGDTATILMPFVEEMGNIELIAAVQRFEGDNIRQLIESDACDLYMEVDGFDENGKLIVRTYADTLDAYSQQAVVRVTTLLEVYESIILKNEGIDTEKYINIYTELATQDTASVTIISMIVPMMLVIMLFANAMSISAESIAGEKERGTLATIIMTPVRRSDIIFAKVFANGIITLLTAVSTFIGMIMSLDSMTSALGITGSVTYAFTDYVILLLMVFAVALTAVSLFSIASALAKNVKEASSISMPLYLVGMVAAIASSYATVPTQWYMYLIPVYNCASVLKSVMTFDVNPVNLAVTLVSSVVFFVAVCLILGRLFRKEKILFAH